MLPADSAGVRGGRVCLVVADAGGLTAAAIGSEPAHVLYCGPGRIPKAAARDLRAAGVVVSVLGDFEPPPHFRVPNLYEPAPADGSDRVRHALEQFHTEHHFDRIEFGVRGGLGFRAVQAKRAGLAFADVPLVARLDGCGTWDRERASRWPGGFSEVEVDFAERYSFENADARLTPTPDLLAFVGRLGWTAEPAPAAEQPPSGDAPLVTIGIAHYNLGRHLPQTLASLAVQTYPRLDVVIIDDGSTDTESARVFGEMEARYPQYRFFRQANAGIGATRNRCLSLAKGEFFIPVDADNLARPEMVERFVGAIRRNPGLAAMTCYFLAFADGIGEPPTEFLYACRPAGGPHVLASIRNVYGDANAVFRTEAFRAVVGYETDRGTSCEDWEAFVKLVHAGRRVGVVPDHLFYYRHLPDGFSRRTNWFANHQRVLRQFTKMDGLPPGEGEALWTALLGFHMKLEHHRTARPPPAPPRRGSHSRDVPAGVAIARTPPLTPGPRVIHKHFLNPET